MSLPSLSLQGKVNALICPNLSLNFQGLHGDRCGEGTWVRVLSCFYSSVCHMVIVFARSLLILFSKWLYLHCHCRSQGCYAGCWRAHLLCNLLVHKKIKTWFPLLKFIAAQCNLKNVQVIGIECDVSVESSVQNAYEIIIATFGRIDAVVASAGMPLSILF